MGAEEEAPQEQLQNKLRPRTALRLLAMEAEALARVLPVAEAAGVLPQAEAGVAVLEALLEAALA